MPIRVTENFTREEIIEKSKLKDKKRKSRISYFCDYVIHFCFYVIVFLIPIIFIPYTFEILEFNKQIVLYILVLVALIAWITKIMLQKRLVFTYTLLDIPILVFVLVYILSTIFSVDKITSIFGFYGRFDGGLISIIAYTLLYFIIVNNVKDIKIITRVFASLLISTSIVVIFSILQTFEIFILPFDFSKIKSFNLAGSSLNLLSIFLAFNVPIIVSLLIKFKKIYIKIPLILLLVAIFLLLIFIDSAISWIGIVAGMVVLFAFAIVHVDRIRSKWIVMAPTLLVLSVVFLLIPTADIFKLGLQSEISLSHGISWSIVKNNFNAHPVLGSGPETFINAFSKYKPEDFNKSLLWNLRFDRPSSHILNLLSNTGIFGIISFASITIVFLWVLISSFSKKRLQEDIATLGIGIIAAWFLLFIIGFIYFSNSVSSLFFWLSMGFVMALVSILRKDGKKEISISFESSPRIAFISSFVFMAILILSITLFYFIGRIYIADINYKQGRDITIISDKGVADKVISFYSNAVNLNNYRDVYHLALAESFLQKVNLIASSLNADKIEDVDRQEIQDLITISINEGKKAVDLGKQNVMNWQGLAAIYRNVRFYAQGTSEWIIKSLEKAIELEPTNPALYTEMGKAYIAKIDETMRQKLNESKESKEQKVKDSPEYKENLYRAIDYFKRAVSLKQNYFDAHYSLGQLYNRENKIDEAIKELEVASNLLPQNVDVLYELGIAYFNDKQTDKALAKFEEAIKINPNHVNTLYSLGIIYEQKGDKTKALENYKKASELNPNREDIKKKIEELK